MPDVEAFRRAASENGIHLKELAKQKASILMLGHIDADGIASMGVLARALAQDDGLFTARAIADVNPRLLDEVAKEGFDFYLFCEVGSGHVPLIEEHLKGKYLLVDHHQLTDEERDNPHVFNVNSYGFDGARELSGAGVSYYLASNMASGARSMAWLAVVGALGDRQDQGTKRSLLGLNEQLATEAMATGHLELVDDLLVFGRGVRPIHESVAMTFDPYIQGLSGNKDACLAALQSAGLELKEASRWRVTSELTAEEKERLVLTLTPYLEISGEQAAGITGNVYLLKKEDERTYLRDARDFASLLDATGRMNKAGLGIALCMGDRGSALTDAEKTLIEFRNTVVRYLHVLLSDEERVIQDGPLVQLVGDGIVQENMTGALSNALSNMPQLKGKLIVLRTITKSGEIKFSVRKGRGAFSSLNLGSIMLRSAAIAGGNGGGHDSAAGARVPAVKAGMFYEKLKSGVS
ncbi:MAG TPA: DHH family phosphoesterase [Conexivisphaerales archaeon]|nr:DHH family phosphoesterase [Conexivisphaerales archaeon]